MKSNLWKNRIENLIPGKVEKAFTKASDLVKPVLDDFLSNAGDQVEWQLGDRHVPAPLLPKKKEEIQSRTWYKVPLKDGLCGDGSPYHIYLRFGPSDRLVIYLSGGGIAWHPYSADNPVTGGRVAVGSPNFYWNNLRPFTEIYNINTGITDNSERNPFSRCSFAVITYATGDFHIGDRDYTYTRAQAEEGHEGQGSSIPPQSEHKLESGQTRTVHFHGYQNFHAAMREMVKYFKDPERILIAGESAGAFAVPALAPEIIEEYYPGCQNITLLSDSAQLFRKDWRQIVKNQWHAQSRFYQCISSENLFMDWYDALMDRYRDRCTCLYAGSVRDYLLSTFLNDYKTGSFTTNAFVQELYYKQVPELLSRFHETAPKGGIFLYNFKQPLSGGTIHTAVRNPHFFLKNEGTCSMARWLRDATRGVVYDVGVDLL